MTNIEKETEQTDELRWMVHPLWDYSSAKSIALIVLYMSVVGIVKYSFGEWWYALFAGVILFLALSKYFLPTQYLFTDKGIEIKFCGLLQKRDWEYYQSYFSAKTGIFLSPFEKKSYLENFRGNYILFDKENREKVIAFVELKIKKRQ